MLITFRFIDVSGKCDVVKNVNDAASDFCLVKQNSLWSHSQHLCNFHPQEPASNLDYNVLSETDINVYSIVYIVYLSLLE